MYMTERMSEADFMAYALEMSKLKRREYTQGLPGGSKQETTVAGVIAAAKQDKDPTGKSAHSPGAKLDAGKVRPALVLGGFARALLAVSRIGTFGASKYTENGWIEVPKGVDRYDDAQLRHWLTEHAGEEIDPESAEEHAAHAAWNALARLDLLIRQKESRK